MAVHAAVAELIAKIQRGEAAQSIHLHGMLWLILLWPITEEEVK